jgi:hypothetical protein
VSLDLETVRRFLPVSRVTAATICRGCFERRRSVIEFSGSGSIRQGSKTFARITREFCGIVDESVVACVSLPHPEAG